MHNETYNGYDIRIDYDQFSDSPEEWGNFTISNFKDTDFDDEEAMQLLQDKLAKGERFLIDKYEHSSIIYSLAGEGTQDRFDTSKHWGYIEFSDEYIKGVSLEDRKTYAKQDLETYTQWVNGEVYEVYIYEENINGEDDEMVDGSGGCFGTLEELLDQAHSTIDRLNEFDVRHEARKAKKASAYHE